MTPERKGIIAGIIIAAVVLVAGLAWGQTRVIDGDTISLDGERVRIFGLDCPERRDPGGSLATRTLAMMLEGKTLTLKRRGKDRYNRTVAKVFADGRDVTCLMIRAKVCREYLRYSHGEYEQC